TGFGSDLLHGEAVAAGMALAFDFSARLGYTTAQTADRVRRHLTASGSPNGLGALGGERPDPDRLLQHMRHDKKVSVGRLTYILAREIGEAFVAYDVPDASVRDFLAAAAYSCGRKTAGAAGGALLHNPDHATLSSRSPRAHSHPRDRLPRLSPRRRTLGHRSAPD